MMILKKLKFIYLFIFKTIQDIRWDEIFDRMELWKWGKFLSPEKKKDENRNFFYHIYIYETELRLTNLIPSHCQPY